MAKESRCCVSAGTTPRLGSTRWRVFALSGLSFAQCTSAIWMCSMAMREVAEFNGC